VTDHGGPPGYHCGTAVRIDLAVFLVYGPAFEGPRVVEVPPELVAELAALRKAVDELAELVRR
jgi:hypothetical protein